jgi:hypothetical protein
MTAKLDKLDNTETHNNQSYGDLIIAIGSSFINAPYRAATLEAPGKEKLIINLSGFDCTTFVETVLALTRCAINSKITAAEFRKTLKFIRYRQGAVAGYSSRLHYFTDWLRDNEKKKLLIDVTKNLDCKPLRKKINYMTSHRELYPALNNKNEFQKTLSIEKSLSRKVFHIVSKNKVNTQKEKIQNGDIIAFTTHQEGLDVTHVGFALRKGKNLHLLHASSKEGAVVISKKTLSAYLQSKKDCTGIIVVKLQL